jgi:hypothetical protein
LAARLGLNVDNPIFGQWAERAAHNALHTAGYNQEWRLFLGSLERAGTYGDDAYRAVVRFINQNAPNWGFTTSW